MKFLCDSCGTKYSISDDRVRGRVLKIRCKKCDFVITVREDEAGAASDPVEEQNVLRASGVQASMIGATAAPEPLEEERTAIGALAPESVEAMRAAQDKKEADDWFVSFDGEQEGPYSLDKARTRVEAELPTGKEAHAWRPGFLVWLPIEEVPELAQVGKVRAPVPPPSSGPRPAPPAAAFASKPAAIAKDPSGPRAALSVSAGEKPKAPPIPHAASAAPSGGLFAQTAPQAAPAIQSMFPSPPPSAEEELDEDDDGGEPDLPISTEASGLVNLAHLAQAAMGQRPAGPVFVNGHTGRQGAMPRGMAPSPALEPVEPAAATSSAPVVVVSGAAPAGASPIFKYVALGMIPLMLGLGAVVIYLLTHRSTETIVVTEPSRHRDDSPITVNDPNVPAGTQQDPKRGGGSKRTVVAQKGPAPQPGAKSSDAQLSGSQRSLADLYKEDGDRATPHAIGSRSGADAQGGQVSQQAIIGVVNANKRQLSTCYERALKHDSSLKSGRVPIQVTVGMSGRVVNVTIPEAQYASSELGQCFVSSVKRWSFPASDAQYSTEFPFILQSQ